MLSSPGFLATSDRTEWRDYFDGYSFVGTDFISGPGGLAQFQEWNGREVGPGQDGCYVVARRTPSGLVIGTDGLGMRRLYLYTSGTRWGISDSFSLLVEAIRSRGWRLDLLPELLTPFAVRGIFTSQLTSSQTMFSQIALLPRASSVSVRGSSFLIEKSHSYAPGVEDQSYESALSRFINLWRDRLATLFSEPQVTMSVYLTADVNSQVLLALAGSVGIPEQSNNWFETLSASKDPVKLHSVAGLAASHGQTLNSRHFGRRAELSGLRGYEWWHAQLLGVYLPVEVPNREFGPLDFVGRGASSVSDRVSSDSDTIINRLNRYSSDLPIEVLDAWKVKVLSGSGIADVCDSTSTHYLEFRHRFVVGNSMQRRTSFAPLNSVGILALLSQFPEVSFQRICRDILSALRAPRVIPTRARLVPGVSLSQRFLDVAGTPAPGRVYSADQEFESAGMGKDSYREWLRSASRAVENPRVEGFVGPGLRARAHEALITAQSTPRTLGSNNRGLLDVSYCVSVEFALGI